MFEREPALLEWLGVACQDIAVEPLVNDQGFDFGCQVVVNNGLTGEGREEAVMATCANQDEAELVAFALWAVARRWTDE